MVSFCVAQQISDNFLLWSPEYVTTSSSSCSPHSTYYFSKLFFWLLVCSYGTRSGMTVLSRWCTAPACGSLIGATPSSPSSTLTTPCCLCLVSTWDHTTPRPEKLLSSVWVGTKKKENSQETHNSCVSQFPVDVSWKWIIFRLDINLLLLSSLSFHKLKCWQYLWSPFEVRSYM